jgi:hypothetical protein
VEEEAVDEEEGEEEETTSSADQSVLSSRSVRLFPFGIVLWTAVVCILLFFSGPGKIFQRTAVALLRRKLKPGSPSNARQVKHYY